MKSSVRSNLNSLVRDLTYFGGLILIGLAVVVLVFYAFLMLGTASSGSSREVKSIIHSMQPIVSSVKEYKQQQGHFPKSEKELRAYLDKAKVERPTHDDLWGYSTHAPQDSFFLHIKVFRDSSLQYEYSQGSEVWKFDPGDGSPGEVVNR